MRRSIMAAVMAAAGMAITGAVQAGTSVAWVDPANGTTFPCGTVVTPTGQASSAGVVGGTGLDLALVIDTSGSMAGAGIAAAKNASVALVNSLPLNTTSVTIIEFDSSAGVVKVLTALSSDKAGVITAINSLGTGGLTAIGAGIQVAANELTGVRHTAGRSQQMVVLSDGYYNTGIHPVTAANNAKAAGVDLIHTVGTPGHDPSMMADIAVAGTGVYTAVNDLDDLIGIFDGTAGNLVGLDYVEVTMPDGTTQVVPTDGLGNFSAPAGWTIQSGAQTWEATAYGLDGTSASASLTLNGVCQDVPDTSSTLPLLGLGLIGLFGLARRHSAR